MITASKAKPERASSPTLMPYEWQGPWHSGHHHCLFPIKDSFRMNNIRACVPSFIFPLPSCMPSTQSLLSEGKATFHVTRRAQHYSKSLLLLPISLCWLLTALLTGFHLHACLWWHQKWCTLLCDQDSLPDWQQKQQCPLLGLEDAKTHMWSTVKERKRQGHSCKEHWQLKMGLIGQLCVSPAGLWAEKRPPFIQGKKPPPAFLHHLLSLRKKTKSCG